MLLAVGYMLSRWLCGCHVDIEYVSVEESIEMGKHRNKVEFKSNTRGVEGRREGRLIMTGLSPARSPHAISRDPTALHDVEWSCRGISLRHFPQGRPRFFWCSVLPVASFALPANNIRAILTNIVTRAMALIRGGTFPPQTSPPPLTVGKLGWSGLCFITIHCTSSR